MTSLDRLAEAAGLHRSWEDYRGQSHRVGEETLRAVLAALGLPARTPAQVAESRRRLEEEQAEAGCRFLTAEVGEPVPLPGTAAGRVRVLLEDGRRLDRSTDAAGRLPALDEPGYHRLGTAAGEITLAVAPSRCLLPSDLAGDGRIWGASVQVPALRGEPSTAFGGFAAVGGFAEGLARGGADALAISPVHALFPADADRFSPYGPSSRLFLNVLLADPAVVGSAWQEDDDAGCLIDWGAAIPQRLAGLRRLYAGLDGRALEDLAAYEREQGRGLERHALFDALHAHFFENEGAKGWQDWPSAYRDPESGAVAGFAREQGQEVGFYRFLQWLAVRSLERAQSRARDAGMVVGLISDLAVGIDGGGSDVWSRRDEVFTGLSIGAPPDPLQQAGQNWGLTTFSPLALKRSGFEAYLDMLRAALRHAGGIRIDHILGMRRLWVVPAGAAATEGCYLTMPERDLLRLLVLESRRAGATVIGEDLGTVPPGLRENLAARGIQGMRILLFERDGDGKLSSPAQWDPTAAAMTGTHDLPTLAGWWRGRDIDWTWRIGRKSDFADETAERRARAQDRRSLWLGLVRAGQAEGTPPPEDDPDPAVTAASAFVAATPCPLALFPAEDLFGLEEQPNLPGTIDEHPNWRRRLPAPAEELLEEPAVESRLQRIREARGARGARRL